MHRLRKAFIRLTGYFIYKKKHLTTGVDVLLDISNHFPDAFREMRTVVDVGANTGQSAQRFHADLPNCTIHYFEPDPATYDRLVENTRSLNRVKTYQLGMGNKAEKKELHIGKHSAWNSMQPDINTTQTSIWVDVNTVDQICTTEGIARIDLFKTDTEGFDLQVLKGAEAMLSTARIRFIYTEVGFYGSNPRNTSLEELIPYLHDFGYYLFAVYEVSKGGSKMVNGNALFVHKSLVKARYEIG
jgi:FkbM family methyltransferase